MVVEAVEGAVSRRASVAATRDGYRGCREPEFRGYGESWVEEHG